MNKYTVYRTTLSSIELEGKSLKDIESQIEEIDGDDKDWVYYDETDETFDVIEHGDGERIKECLDCENVSTALCESSRDKYCVNCGNIQNKKWDLVNNIHT